MSNFPFTQFCFGLAATFISFSSFGQEIEHKEIVPIPFSNYYTDGEYEGAFRAFEEEFLSVEDSKQIYEQYQQTRKRRNRINLYGLSGLSITWLVSPFIFANNAYNNTQAALIPWYVMGLGGITLTGYNISVSLKLIRKKKEILDAYNNAITDLYRQESDPHLGFRVTEHGFGLVFSW